MPESRRIDSLIVSLALLTALPAAQARPDILQAWQQRYAESNSDRRGCQLCHQNSNGGDGWNAYGFEIRFQFNDVFGSLDIQAALAATESFNSDGDALNLTNLKEIELDLDPGWIEGPFNPIFFKQMPSLENQFPPFTDTDAVAKDDFCIPLIASSGNTALICL